MKQIIGIMVLLVFTNVIYAEMAPEETWSKTFGGSGVDHAHSVQQTSDGGYIIAGYTPSYGAGEHDFWLVKTDSDGNEEWNKTFGGSDVDSAYSVQQTSDGGYILAGNTYSYGDDIGGDFWLVKTDSEGNKEWDKTFGGSGIDVAHSVQQTSDGGYILIGTTYSDDYVSDFWLVKTDSDGNNEWDKTFGGSGNDDAYSVHQTSDGGYILAGRTRSYGAGGNDFWLVKTDSDGNEQWDKTFGGSDHDDAHSVQQTSDGGYIIAGNTHLDGADKSDFWLVKTDSDGNKEWDKTFGGSGNDCAQSVHQTSDGGYILAGDTGSYGAGSFDFWLVKTDSDGNKEWDKTFGGSDGDIAHSVQQTSDGGYILTGTTHSYGDFWLIKIGGTDTAPPPAKATPTATTEVTPATTSTPGFTVGFAIAWLLAVAYLVLRQRRE